jgi:hypothetical protein
MNSVDELVQELLEAKKKKAARQKHFDDISCEDALKMVEKRVKQLKGRKIKEAKIGYDEFIGKGQEIWDVVMDQGRLKNRKVSVQTNPGGTVKDVEAILKRSFGNNLFNIRAKKTGKIREDTIKEVRETEDTEGNLSKVQNLMKKIDRRNFDLLLKTTGKNPRLKIKVNVAMIDLLDAFDDAGIS